MYPCLLVTTVREYSDRDNMRKLARSKRLDLCSLQKSQYNIFKPYITRLDISKKRF